MPKRKKQNQHQPPTQQQPPLPEREETGDEEDGSPIDKSDRPVCRHFAKKGHCRYEDLCAFYHPGVNGPPL
ncbi:hypothetical protein H8959_009841 [Pygathrix nigripes]